MSDSEVFREVDEDYRRERTIAFWRRYGSIILGLAVVAMIVAGAVSYRQKHLQNQMAAQTAVLESLLAAVTPENEAQAADGLEAYAAQADQGHATLALLTAASLRQRSGAIDAAARIYHQLADNSATDPDIRDLAVVRLGYLAADQAKPEPIIPRLQAIAEKASPWGYGAREAIAILTARAGQRDEAARMLSDLAGDPGAPPDLAGRARALADLYRGK